MIRAHPLHGVFGPDPRGFDPARAGDLLDEIVSWTAAQVDQAMSDGRPGLSDANQRHVTFTTKGTTMVKTQSVNRAPTIAIVGSGPSGCYIAQFLRKRWPAAEIVIFDRLDHPYGLVNYGVALDHPGTKAVARQFDRLFDKDGVRFAGKVEIGTDITLDELRSAFDIVVLATGLHGDRTLDVPGAELPGRCWAPAG